MRAYVIHMSSSTARRPNADQLLRDLPDAALIEAADGRDPAQIAHLRWSNGTLHRPHYPFALSKPEIGLFESHRRCWQALVDSDADYALIAEDDLSVDGARLTDALDLITQHAAPDMFIRLPVKPRERPAQVLAQQGNLHLFLPRVIGLQTVAQVVGRHAAARLLQVTQAVDRPVDTFLQMHWATGQPVHTIPNTGIREIGTELGGSTIQKKHTSQGRLARELRRALYRAKVAARPQKSDSNST